MLRHWRTSTSSYRGQIWKLLFRNLFNPFSQLAGCVLLFLNLFQSGKVEEKGSRGPRSELCDCVCVCVGTQLYLTLCDPMDCSLPLKVNKMRERRGWILPNSHKKILMTNLTHWYNVLCKILNSTPILDKNKAADFL